VGFRPFVFRLANESGLAGWVRNDGEGVEIALEGAHQHVLDLVARLQSEPPRLARVEKVILDLNQAAQGLHGFIISASGGGRVQTGISPDMSVCADCLDEMFDVNDRRYRYPFINCIHCGPRYTIADRLPYDRAHTSMAGFTQCGACQREYDHPETRRFHAQPNACPVCGPQLTLWNADWQRVDAVDPIAETIAVLRNGQVVSIKGIGGFHLVGDARNAAPVENLRSGKRREEKPFAVMVLNQASAGLYATFSDNESALLQSAERPILLLQKSLDCDAVLKSIAPGLSRIGLMLPYTPLHYLLFHEMLGRPQGTDWLEYPSDLALLMTSANPGGAPLVINDDEARQSLSGLADAFLTHNRSILQRCDDSVMKWQGSAPAFVRRARGYTPRRILLPFSAPSVLACGAWLKNTVCITRGNESFVSQHIGDLDQSATRAMLDETVAHLCNILDVQPQAVAHDLHPDFYSTQFAQQYAEQHGLPNFAVQHQHAHIAAICAEHGVNEPVLGLALDGVGLGGDGQAWGGELLLVKNENCQRLGHLAPLHMPGGDKSAREPWRMAAAALHGMGRTDEIAQRFADQTGATTIAAMLQRSVNCPATSSMGRLFDAASGLLGVNTLQSYEGQAAMLLEGLADQHGSSAPLNHGFEISDKNLLDFLPLLAALSDCDDAAFGAALFHATLAEGLATWVKNAAAKNNLGSVALGGGCFLNTVLSQSLTHDLAEQGLRVFTAQQLPPNDGSIALGQAWVAMHHLSKGTQNVPGYTSSY
jgi:hydrogenase maturation protein HypF